jgi:site-specific recombinase XerD
MGSNDEQHANSHGAAGGVEGDLSPTLSDPPTGGASRTMTLTIVESGVDKDASPGKLKLPLGEQRRSVPESFMTDGEKVEFQLREQLPVDRNPALIYIGSLAEGSRRTMRGSLELLARFVSGGSAGAANLAWWRLRYQHTALLQKTLAASYAPSTANKVLTALRGVLRECFRLGLMSAEDYERARDIKSVKGSRLPPGRHIDGGELLALFRACATDEKRVRGARDGALLALLYVCGLRRNEASNLKLSDYDSETLRIRVIGKGNKERSVYAAGGAEKILKRWLRYRGEDSGPMFHPVNKGGRIRRLDEDGGPRRLSEQAIYDVVRRRHKEIGVAKPISPHSFRATFIGDLLDAGADLSSAQKLAGHADPRTTARYDRRGERALKKSASLLHVPYLGDGEED